MLAYEEWRQLFKAGKLNAVQSAFYQAKPAELLFDTESDPHQVKNLADDPAHADTLKSLRAALQKKSTQPSRPQLLSGKPPRQICHEKSRRFW